MNTDRFQKEILLHAPRTRVWRALTGSTEFGTWFGAKFTDPFTAGANMRGVIKPTAVDKEVAEMQKPNENYPIEIVIDRIEPEQLFSFRWHPYAIDRAVDYSKEPFTLVEFALRETTNGMLLTVSESGFDRLPAERREKAFAANEQGWSIQMQLIEKYLGQATGAAG